MIKSLFGALFGGRSAQGGKEEPSEPVEYKGFVIRAAPYKSEGQYQTAGVIEKEVAGVRKEHRFVRADRHPSREQAISFSLDKARQIVDLQGERIFD